MANKGKRISELTQLTSASLDTTIVGIDNGTTYKIELDTLADAVALRVNILDRDRLDSLESKSGSYLTSLNGTISGSSQLTSSYDARYVVSGSITQTTWDNISGKPNGLISQSTDLSQLNTFTQSIDGRINSLESETGSYLTSLNGTISSSAQITSFGFVSQSADITLLNSFTASQSILNTAFTNGISARLQTSSFNEFSASIHSEIVTSTSVSSIQTITSASYAALTPVSGTLYIIIG